jgi:hypothetical protein
MNRIRSRGCGKVDNPDFFQKITRCGLMCVFISIYGVVINLIYTFYLFIKKVVFL